MGGGSQVEGEYELVDLGLPSGILWGTKNLGAATEIDCGLYFQWGDTKGYKNACEEVESYGNNEAHYFGWSEYKYCNGYENSLTKYCIRGNQGTLDYKLVLDSEDDAATIMIGYAFKTPTENEFQELLNYTDPGDGTRELGWINNYKGTGISGVLRKSRTNGNTIFFPAAGYGRDNSISSVNVYGCCWASNLNTSDSNTASYFDFTMEDVFTGTDKRYHGYPIRPVRKPVAVY